MQIKFIHQKFEFMLEALFLGVLLSTVHKLRDKIELADKDQFPEHECEKTF